jgi:hypothetical protein
MNPNRAGVGRSVPVRRGCRRAVGESSAVCRRWLWFAAVAVAGHSSAFGAETTIYVNRHFEVRGHDQPVKYVWNGETRVARITGSLSTNPRIVRRNRPR